MAQGPLAEISGVTRQFETMALHAYEQRHRVIAHNIANVDSEGFQPLRVDFEEQLEPLRNALRNGDSPEHLAALVGQVRPKVELAEAATGSFAEPGENLDDQLVALTQNTLDYEAMLTAVARLDGLNLLAVTGS